MKNFSFSKSLKMATLVVTSSAMLLVSCTSYTPITATSNPVGNKCGTASHWSFLIFSGGANLGINKAAKEAGITSISHIDLKTTRFLCVYQKTTLLVYGE